MLSLYFHLQFSTQNQGKKIIHILEEGSQAMKNELFRTMGSEKKNEPPLTTPKAGLDIKDRLHI